MHGLQERNEKGGSIEKLACENIRKRWDSAYLDMLLEILRTLKRFSTEVTLMWLQRNVNTDMRRDVVAFDGGGPALVPATSEVQVVGTLSTDMLLTDVFL